MTTPYCIPVVVGLQYFISAWNLWCIISLKGTYGIPHKN